MKFKILTVMVASLVSMSSMAVTFDYRHEMQDTKNADHKDRLLISHRFENGFGLSSEVKWKQSSNDSTPNKPYNEQVSNGTEVTASYLYKFNKMFSTEAGFNLVSDNTGNTYRPYIKGGVNFTDSLYYTLRYRPFYQRFSSSINTTVPADTTNMKGYTITSVLGYKFLDNFTVEYELEYNKNTKAGVAGYRFDSDSDNFTHDVKLAYKIDKNWTPYVQVANVEGSKATDERQTRYRVGVQYNF
ncbi:oligogalacturonate-specific porin KdgM family protein [Dickeya dadantii]|uniref:oligogalacturonate-specific porin KdgM family protein n=1 Tax=Dickeya dadantii TaxID=204038 RepID=UPI001C0BE0A1|nr:oligogalacturonate-specific porin KdgM family protein [Dickeya dadantii]MCA7012264.1 oligogalacturonate-specific porin KdgM family protein [Dickeya dadantii]QWT40778.1 oligogalacturonate-specific porin KdgM family protein [Dickeya dadantii]